MLLDTLLTTRSRRKRRSRGGLPAFLGKIMISRSIYILEARKRKLRISEEKI
ncbi:Protein of unknown function [Gryllus bimaculatus]|nr:Protein of unknown function [Gryllus bimaculatus]